MKWPRNTSNMSLDFTQEWYPVEFLFWTNHSKLLSDSSPNSSNGRLKPRLLFHFASSWPFCVSSTPHWYLSTSIWITLTNGSIAEDWFTKPMYFWPSTWWQAQLWHCSNQVLSLRNWRFSTKNISKERNVYWLKEKLMRCTRDINLTLQTSCLSTFLISWPVSSSLQLSHKPSFSVSLEPSWLTGLPKFRSWGSQKCLKCSPTSWFPSLQISCHTLFSFGQ